MIAFGLLDARAQKRMKDAPFHEWLFPDGEKWTQFFRTGSGYLLRFPELADFEIANATLAVACRPAPDVTLDTCEHLYLNQVLPLVLSKQGKLVFHGSAVEMGGVAAAFLADSGRGKSTLAAAFAAGGHRFLTDDGLVLEPGADGYLILPSHPSIRLWEDSQDALVAATSVTAQAVQHTAKLRFMAGAGIAYCPDPKPLRRAYFLGDGQAPTIAFKRLSGPKAMMEWVKHSFLLDPGEPALLAAHFSKVAELANRIDCYRLDYPRHFEELPGVRQAIIDHLLEEGVTA